MPRKKQILMRIKKQLFSNPTDCLISLIILSLISWSTITTANWLLNIARWNVVTDNISLYTFGSYPEEQLWRPLLWLIALIILVIITIISPKYLHIRKSISLLWIAIVPLGLILLAGGFGLQTIPSRNWGGVILTLILTLSSFAIALPLGIALAIGRQSKLHLIKQICGSYIDLMRSIPLIAVLFFGQLLIPMFLPMGLEVNRVFRAILAFGLFASAYIAEDIRCGFQSIPNTQIEAAYVLGLSKWQTIRLVLLPQAIRTALPALTNQAIGLLQNTSLMAILGLVELLGISRSLLANPEFIGRYLEVYVWLALIYWFICTLMALLSRKIEHQLKT